MAQLENLTIRLRIVYDGTPPNTWDGGPADFGLQDKANVLHLGKTEHDGRVVFEVSLPAKTDHAATLVFLGDFAHGTPKERFLYLSWRNANGAYAQRLKLPLGGITWADIETTKEKLLVGEVAPSNKPRVPGAANIGGTREVFWKPEDG